MRDRLLRNADRTHQRPLINDEVDTLVNSYIRIPEDEKTVENFGETPYYIVVRREDTALTEQLDYAIGRMNEALPNWRTELYNKYYGVEESAREFTADELSLLGELRADGTVLRAVMAPNANPYSWYEDGEARGIAADIFRAAAEQLGLDYEIPPVTTRAEYMKAVMSGSVDIWVDMVDYYEDKSDTKYKITDPYMTTTMSVLRTRGASKKIETLITDIDDIAVREMLSPVWPEAKVTYAPIPSECRHAVLIGTADAALLMSYTAKRLAREDIQNRLHVDIVPGAVLELKMGINASEDYRPYGLWSKALAGVAETSGAEIVQGYLEKTTTPSSFRAPPSLPPPA